MADLLTIATEADRLIRLLPELVTPVVVDANALLEDLLRRHRGARVALVNAATLGSGRLFITSSVLDEVHEHLPRVGRKHDLAALKLTLVTTYLPRLRVVDVSDVAFDDERLRQVAAADPDDVDTATLALVLAPSCLLTNDRDLLDSGFGVIFDPEVGRAYWTLGAVALESQGLLVGVVGGMGMTGELTLASLPTVTRSAGKLLADDRAVAAILVLIGAALLVAASPPLRVRVERAFAAVSDAAGAVTRGLGTVFVWAAEARQLLEQTAVRSTQTQSPRDVVARTLATGAAGLTAGELQSLVPGDVDVARELRSWRMFVEVNPNVWALGRSAASFTGEIGQPSRT